MDRKKVLMIFPNHYLHTKWHWIPTNFIFLASTLIGRGYKPILVDDRLLTRAETLKIIEDNINDTLVVLISTATGRQLYNTRILAEYIKRKASIPICVGGAHPSALPKLTLTDKNLDYVIEGQGEQAVCDLCDLIYKNKQTEDNLNLIPNLYFRTSKNNIVKATTPFKKINVRDMPPLPYFNKDFIDIEHYLNPNTLSVNYTTSSGCIGSCDFCYFPEDYKFSAFTTTRVIDDLKRFKANYRIKNLTFDDPTFFVSPKRSVEIAKLMIKENLSIMWRANGRVDTLSKFQEDDMMIIRDAGCHIIHVGLESASERLLKMMNKQINHEDCIKLVHLSKISEIRFRFHLMFGLPSETIDDLKITSLFLKKMLRIYPAFDYTCSFFTPYPGNILTKLVQQFGYIQPSTLKGYESVEYLNHKYLPENDRIVAQETSPWVEDYDIPWYSEKYNREYMQAFRELIPEKRDMLSTGGQTIDIFSHE